MNERINAFKARYRENPGWCWLEAIILFFPILPEYISPFLLFTGFIVFKRQWTKEGRKAKVGTLGKLEIAFMSLALLSTLWSGTKLDTLGTAGLWWGMFLVQVMIYNLGTTRKRIDRILKLIVYGGIANSICGVIQICTYTLNKFGHLSEKFILLTPFYKSLDKAVYTWLPFQIKTNTFADRASGFFSNPNLLATYLIFAYPISIYLFLNAKNQKEKITYFIFNLLICAGISSTLTRAGCVIALFGWIFMFIILAKRHWKQLLTIIMPTAAVIVPSILTRYGLIFQVQNTAVNNSKVVIPTPKVTVNNAEPINSTNAHFEIWKSTFDYIVHNIKVFFGGLGFGCESTGIMLTTAYDLNKPHAHNFVLEIWAELGIIGIILLAVIILCAFGKLLEINANNGKKFDLVFCVFTSLLLFLLFGLTDYVFNSPKQIILFMILMGLTQAISQCYEKTLIKSPDDFIKVTERDLKSVTHLK